MPLLGVLFIAPAQKLLFSAQSFSHEKVLQGEQMSPKTEFVIMF
jgi:hypothetical protein